MRITFDAVKKPPIRSPPKHRKILFLDPTNTHGNVMCQCLLRMHAIRHDCRVIGGMRVDGLRECFPDFVRAPGRITVARCFGMVLFGDLAIVFV